MFDKNQDFVVVTLGQVSLCGHFPCLLLNMGTHIQFARSFCPCLLGLISFLRLKLSARHGCEQRRRTNSEGDVGSRFIVITPQPFVHAMMVVFAPASMAGQIAWRWMLGWVASVAVLEGRRMMLVCLIPSLGTGGF